MVDGEEENKNQLDKSNEEQIPKISKNDLEKEDRDKCEKENTSDSVFHSEKKLYLLNGKAERETVGWFICVICYILGSHHFYNASKLECDKSICDELL